jgi:hypothetical protein
MTNLKPDTVVTYLNLTHSDDILQSDTVMTYLNLTHSDDTST